MQQHKSSIVMFKILQSAVSKNWKTSATEKSKGNTTCSKQREGQKEITIFCSINCKILIYLCCLLQ